MTSGESNRRLRPPGKPYGGDDARRAAIARTCFEVAEALDVGLFDDEDDCNRRDRAFRVLAEVIADAAGADDAETLRVAFDWLSTVIARYYDEEEPGWHPENVGRLDGLRLSCLALSWVAATRPLGIE